MKNNLICFIIALNFALLGCSFLGTSHIDRPGWVDEISSTCTDGHFCAVGSGDEDELARARAMANLAKIFENQIEARFETNLSNDNGVESESAEDSIIESTKVMLEGAEIKRMYYDYDKKHYFAFAEISKSKLSRLIKKDQDAIDEEIKGLLVEPTLGKLSKINVLLDKRLPLERKAQFLSGISFSAPITKEELAKKRSLLRKNITVYFETKESGPIKFLPYVKEAFSKAGYIIVNGDKARATHLVKLESFFQEEYLNVKGFKKQSAKIQFSISTLTVVASSAVNLEYSESGRSLEQAREKIVEKFKEEIDSKIAGFEIE